MVRVSGEVLPLKLHSAYARSPRATLVSLVIWLDPAFALKRVSKKQRLLRERVLCCVFGGEWRGATYALFAYEIDFARNNHRTAAHMRGTWTIIATVVRRGGVSELSSLPLQPPFGFDLSIEVALVPRVQLYVCASQDL